MTEVTAEQLKLLEEWKAEKDRKAAQKGNARNWWIGFLCGLLFGGCIASIATSVVNGQNFLDTNARTAQAYQNLVTQANQQRDACKAHFQRATILWDTAGNTVNDKLPLFNGLIQLSPGPMLVPQQPRPAWFIPADVPVLFYGQTGTAVISKVDGRGQTTFRGLPLTVADVQADSNALKVN